MKDIAKKYLQRHYKVDTLLGGSPKEGVLVKHIPENKLTFRLFLWFLKGLPWICVISLAFSLVWQFLVMKTTDPDTIAQLTRATALGGLVGYGTNWLAIKMLFKPVVKRPIWGQGLIPAQRDRIVGQLAKGMHEHILNQDLIHKRIEESGIIKKIEAVVMQGTHNLLEDKEFQADVKRVVHDYLKDYLNQKEIRAQFSGAIDTKLEQNIQGGLKGYFFKTYKSWKQEEYQTVLDNLILSLPQTAVEAITALEDQIDDFQGYLKSQEGEIEAFITNMITNLLHRLDIRDLLVKQMAHFEERKLEEMIRNATDEQLLYIQYLGTLLGIFGGLLNFNVAIGLLYIALLAFLYGLDVLIFNLNKKKQIEA